MSRVLHRNLHAPPPLAVSSQGIEIRLADGDTIIEASGGSADRLGAAVAHPTETEHAAALAA
jgi:hypothetical protein